MYKIMLVLVIFSIMSVAFPAEEWLVRFDEYPSVEEVEAFARTFDVEWVRNARSAPVAVFRETQKRSHSLRSRADTHTKDVLSVKYIQPNYSARLFDPVFPDDTYFNFQWGLHNPGGSGRVKDADIDMPEAWEYHTGSGEIIVAVIDTGIDLTHPDLSGNLWMNPNETENGLDDDGNGYIDDIYGWNFRDDNNNPNDVQGHGTSVAGIIGAITNNNIGVAGINWDVSLMALNSFGSENTTEVIYLIDAIDYAIEMGAHIINASWGMHRNSRPLEEAIMRANDAGVLFIAAAGNDNKDLSATTTYPASFRLPNVISVGSMTQTDEISSFSNYSSQNVHLFAPGSSCYTTKIEGEYGFSSGTSFAAPHVAGVAALLWDYLEDADAFTVRNKILGSVVQMHPYKDSSSSRGRLNAHNPFVEQSPQFQAVDNIRLVKKESKALLVSWDTPIEISSQKYPPLYDIRISQDTITEENFYQMLPAQFSMSPSLTGTQQVSIQGLEPDTKYSMAVKVLDNHGNASSMSSVIEFTTRSEPVHIEYDFSVSDGNWQGQAPWIRTDDYWTTNEEEEYASNLNISLTSPEISLKDLSYPLLEIMHQFDFEKSSSSINDYGILEISDNGGTSWHVLKEYFDVYQPMRLDRIPLYNFLDADNMKLRFRFISNDEESGLGWQIASVSILDEENFIPARRIFFSESYRRFNRTRPSSEYNETGTWGDVESHNRTDSFGKKATMARGVLLENAANAEATYTPFFPVDGKYALYTSWGLRGNAYNVSFIVQDLDGEHTILMDQDGWMNNGHVWHHLGEYSFKKGQNTEIGSVTVDASTVTGRPQTSYDGMAVFDLMRWVLIEEYGDFETSVDHYGLFK